MKRWIIREVPTAAQIREIADVLGAGGIVLMPTDTIYGLHALVDDERAAARIAKIKGRDDSKRFVIIAASVAQIESLGAEVPDLTRAMWPAPLTAVLRRGSSTLAARVPDLGWLRDLLERAGPLISTSTNRSGEPPIFAPDEMPTELLKSLDGIADAGRREGKASAIVDFTGAEPKIIRDGDPSFSQLLRKRLRK